jgi:hypothetical protein
MIDFCDKKTLPMKSFITSAIVLSALICVAITASGQKKKILVDVAHGQKFYSDPADKISSDLVPAERLTYMTGELAKNAAAHNADLTYQKKPIDKNSLSKVNLLFIHVPSAKYTADECKAIRDYVQNGGSLFLVIDENYWATLQQVNANDITAPFGITYGEDSTDKSIGGHSTAGKVTSKEYKIPFHGARVVKGGTPFAVSNADATNTFGVFKDIQGGGKIVAMGEGMVSLYMNSWRDVTDYQCAPFMQDVIGWLVK